MYSVLYAAYTWTHLYNIHIYISYHLNQLVYVNQLDVEKKKKLENFYVVTFYWLLFLQTYPKFFSNEAAVIFEK